MKNCEWCGYALYRRLDEDKEGRHDYQWVCRRCNYQSEAVEVLHPATVAARAEAARRNGCNPQVLPFPPSAPPDHVAARLPKPTPLVWALRVALIGLLPAAILMTLSLLVMVNLSGQVA